MRNLSAILLCIFFNGCGSDQVATYPVSGRVVFEDGTLVRTGTVELESKQFGTTATGSINPDGTFVLGTYAAEDGAAAGEHSAIVVQIIIADGSIKHQVDHGRTVPPVYSDYDTSPLRVTVAAAESNTVTLTIDGKR